MLEKFFLLFCRSAFLTVLCIGPMFSGDCRAEKLFDDAEFQIWVSELREEALAKGISAAIFDRAFNGVEPNPKIITSDRHQPEFKQSLEAYLENRINRVRIDRGRELLRKYWRLFAALSSEFEVQSRFLVALWGIETDYGRHQGRVPLIQALATLAYDPRRDEYFRKELLNALQILDQGKAPPEQFYGSWAGAMGQVQFMPSVFLRYAVDYDGDNRADLWQSESDALASAANYLSRLGWKKGWTWGREVILPRDFDPQLVGLDYKLRITDWQKLGVRRLNGANLPESPERASLVLPDGPSGRSFLVYDNYRNLLKWNRSHNFAITVGLLADEIGRP